MKSFKVKLKTNGETARKLLLASSFYRKVYNTCMNEQFLRMVYAAGQVDLYFFEKEELYKAVKKVKKAYFPYANQYDGGILKSAVYDAVDSFILSLKKDWHYKSLKFCSRKKSNMKFKTMSKIKITENYIVLPKIGKVKLYEKDCLPTSGIFEEVLITHDGNDWFAVVYLKEDNPRELAWRGTNTFCKLKSTFKDEDISLLDVDHENLVINGVKLPDVTCSKSYLKVEKKYKSARKKLLRQTKNNMVYTKYGYTCRTSRSMLKTRKEIAKYSTKLENIKKDFFKKTANAVFEKTMAKTKPQALCVLDALSLSRFRGALRTRKQKRAGTGHFFNVLKRKFEYNGAEIYYLSYREYKATLGSRGSEACGEVGKYHCSVQTATSVKQELPSGKEQVNIKAVIRNPKQQVKNSNNNFFIIN